MIGLGRLDALLRSHVEGGYAPGAVALVSRGDEVEVAAVGSFAEGAGRPMDRDTLFRIASITKPVIAVATLLLVEDGRLRLDDAVGRWLPEIETPVVVRRPDGPIDDVVPARRPITVEDLLSSRAGWGFGADFTQPAVQLLVSDLGQGPLQPQHIAAPDAWMGTLSQIPLLHQPGEAWLYNTCSDILGVLITRVAGTALDTFLSERVFGPLGMPDTGFAVPADQLDRLPGYFRATPEGLELVDPPDGQWSRTPAFLSGAGGLVSTVDDWFAFARMLLAQGSVGDRPLLSASSIAQLTTNRLTLDQRRASDLFLEGQGWGFGGSVDVEVVGPWVVPGRYGWVGGTGTSAHVTPSTRTAAILMTQVELAGPVAPTLMRDVWTYAAGF